MLFHHGEYPLACPGRLRHRVSKTDQLYPGYVPEVPPRLLHYGIFWEVGSTGFQWDKHWFRDFDPLACPSDDLVPWSGPFGPGDGERAGAGATQSRSALRKALRARQIEWEGMGAGVHTPW